MWQVRTALATIVRLPESAEHLAREALAAIEKARGQVSLRDYMLELLGKDGVK